MIRLGKRFNAISVSCLQRSFTMLPLRLRLIVDLGLGFLPVVKVFCSTLPYLALRYGFSIISFMFVSLKIRSFSPCGFCSTKYLLGVPTTKLLDSFASPFGGQIFLKFVSFSVMFIPSHWRTQCEAHPQ